MNKILVSADSGVEILLILSKFKGYKNEDGRQDGRPYANFPRSGFVLAMTRVELIRLIRPIRGQAVCGFSFPRSSVRI